MHRPMPEGNWADTDRVFSEALDLADEQRSEFLDTACDGDTELRARVENLLAAAEADDGFMEVSPFQGELLDSLTADIENEPMEGRAIGAYQVVREIGRGGMGAVYLAERVEGGFSQQAALKLIKRGMDTDSVVRRFQREREVLASLQHPNIARLLDGGATEDGRPYFAMEYIDGKPIDVYCDEHGLSIEARLRLFLTVCDAIQYAHRNLVVHRDLKPSNILVMEPTAGTKEAGRVKLLDFGIAGMLAEEGADDDIPLTQTGARMVTPAFAAPEQLRGQRANTATDVYALGLILYVLLTGKRAYDLGGKAASEVERIVLETEPPRPSTRVSEETSSDGVDPSVHRGTTPQALARTLKGDLDTICLRAFQKEPERRYPSAEQLATDIRRYLDGQPIAARPDTFGYRARKFVWRNRLGVGLASLAFFLLVAGVVGVAWQARVAANERDLQTAEAERANSTLGFVREIFRSVSPAETEGAPITAESIVAAGIEQLETVADPLAKAQMAAALADLSFTLGIYETSDSLWGESLRLREQELGPEDLQVSESLFGLAISLQQSEPDSSLGLLERALLIREEAFGPDDPQTLATINELGWTHYVIGDLSIAIAFYDRALGQMTTPAVASHPLRAEGLYGLATVYSAMDRASDAEPLLREALTIRRETLGANDPETLYAEFSLATALKKQGKLDEAYTIYADVLQRYRLVLGDDHNQVANALLALGNVERERERFDSAIDYHRESHDVYIRSLGAENVFTAIPLANWGLDLLEDGRLAEAEAKLREAIALYNRTAGPEYSRTIRTNVWLGRCLVTQGRYSEAEPLLAAALEAVGDNERRVDEAQEALDQLILIHDALGNTEQAAEYESHRNRLLETNTDSG